MGTLYVFRLVDGRGREFWQEADQLGLMQQFGEIAPDANSS